MKDLDPSSEYDLSPLEMIQYIRWFGTLDGSADGVVVISITYHLSKFYAFIKLNILLEIH